MSTEIRFLLAVVLMIGVLVITNLMFPPTPPEELPGYVPPDSVLIAEEGPAAGAPELPGVAQPVPELTAGGIQEGDPLAGMLEDTVSLVPGRFSVLDLLPVLLAALHGLPLVFLSLALGADVACPSGPVSRSFARQGVFEPG